MAKISPSCVITSSVYKHEYHSHESAPLELKDACGMFFMYNILYDFSLDIT